MSINKKIIAFVSLGKFLKQIESPNKVNNELESINNMFLDSFQQAVKTIHIKNPWFTEANVRRSIVAIANSLEENQLIEFTSKYINKIDKEIKPKNIGVVLAGNIPLVGFHDWFCILLSGNKFIGKLSSDDNVLLPLLSEILIKIDNNFSTSIEFITAPFKNIDAVIATGSNNSANYFEYYFSKYPHIIRKNRNSIAVLNGTETKEELTLLGDDIFSYFGLGCRNVSKIFVPEGYNFNAFYEAIIDYKEIVNHNKYANNYEYNRTIYLMQNNNTLLDNNFLLLKLDTSYSSPIGVLFYEFYSDLNELKNKFDSEKEQIQCIVSKNRLVENSINFGKAQSPSLNDYADGIDTMKFLINL